MDKTSVIPGRLYSADNFPRKCTPENFSTSVMFSKKFALLLLLTPFVAAAPAESLDKRQTVDTSNHCGQLLLHSGNDYNHLLNLYPVGQWDTVTAGQYTMYLDQWGKANASSGQSCANFVSLSGTTLAWKNQWTWSGGSGVKSYTNVNLNANLNKQLSAIKSIQVSPLPRTA